jgi:hypothetical protein
MGAYRWEPHWAFMVRMTEPEPPPAKDTPAADAVQIEAHRLWWRFKKLEGRMQSWQQGHHRRGRRRGRR